MIYFVTTKRHDYTIRKSLRSSGAALTDLVRPMNYGRLFLMRRFPEGTYIFSDFERLTESDRSRLLSLREQIEPAPNYRFLNHPSRTLGRLELLNHLYSKGVNTFNGYQLADDPRPHRFPVFIRGEDDHKGALSPLLYNQEELDEAGRQWQSQWGGKHRKLVIEHCDVSDDNGVFRKYAAFRVGHRIIARHLFFGSAWCVKAWELMEPHQLAEESRYVHENPHRNELAKIFGLAGVEFGRIDYGIKDGKIQVWEINTNPVLPVDFGGGGERRQPIHDLFAKKFIRAMRAIDVGESSSRSVVVERRAVPIWSAPKLAGELIYRRATRGARRRA